MLLWDRLHNHLATAWLSKRVLPQQPSLVCERPRILCGIREKDVMHADPHYCFRPIGVIRSCFTENFGIPRQAGLVPDARARLELAAPFASADALRELDGFSHLWVLFIFHGEWEEPWWPLVRPPRLGGNTKVGVFASRSPRRPNPIGLSAVRLLGIEHSGESLALELGGVDLLDGTPVLDIKPYVPYADAIADARAGYAAEAPLPALRVEFSLQAQRQCAVYEARYPNLAALITQMLTLDPRPAYCTDIGGARTFGCRLLDMDVKWNVTDKTVTVLVIEPTHA